MRAFAFVILCVAFTSYASGARGSEDYLERERRKSRKITDIESGVLSELELFKSRAPTGDPSPLTSLGLFLLTRNPAAAFSLPLPSVHVPKARTTLARPQHSHALLAQSPMMNREGAGAIRMTGSTSVNAKKLARPSVGDKVLILSTNNTRKWLPELIGNTSEIIGDAEDRQPFLIEGSKMWLNEEDVEIQVKDSVDPSSATESEESVANNVVIHLDNEDDFTAKTDEAAKEDKLVVIALFASWCRACAAVKPKFKRMVNDWPSVEFCDILFDKNKELAKKNGIKTLPYIWIYDGKKGNVEAFQMGPAKISKLRENLELYTSQTSG